MGALSLALRISLMTCLTTISNTITFLKNLNKEKEEQELNGLTWEETLLTHASGFTFLDSEPKKTIQKPLLNKSTMKSRKFPMIFLTRTDANSYQCNQYKDTKYHSKVIAAYFHIL